MTQVKAFPKIWHVGDRYAAHVFEDDVEVTEKIDGSQFNFGKLDGVLCARSKGKDQHLEAPDKMFRDAINFIKLAEDRLPDNVTFHCEYLCKPKHNTLCYSRVPRNFLICFGISLQDGTFVKDYAPMAKIIGIESVPVLYRGKISKMEQVEKLLETDSILGGTKVEGVVIKNYERPVMIGDMVVPITAVKYVSEAFKEKHTGWKKENTTRGRLEDYIESFRSEARWRKAVQYLRDNGALSHTPRDIGQLLVRIQTDLEEEEQENIMRQLWKEFGPVIKRKSIAGFPEWYKQQLLEGCFNGELGSGVSNEE